MSELAMAYGEMSFREASLHLLAAIVEFLAMLVRLVYEHLQADVPVDIEVASAPVSKEAGSVLEPRGDEGDGEEDVYSSDMLCE